MAARALSTLIVRGRDEWSTEVGAPGPWGQQRWEAWDFGALNGVLWSVSVQLKGPWECSCLDGSPTGLLPPLPRIPLMLVLTRGWQRPHSEAAYGWDLGYFSLPCPCRDPVERIK